MYTQHIDTMLNNALDCGITERDFWEMTFAELDRVADSYNRVQKRKAKEKATFDYIQAMLVGKAIATTLSKGATFPELHEVYPALFNVKQIEAERQEARDNASAIRFKLFVNAFNSTLKGGQKANE